MCADLRGGGGQQLWAGGTRNHTSMQTLVLCWSIDSILVTASFFRGLDEPLHHNPSCKRSSVDIGIPSLHVGDSKVFNSDQEHRTASYRIAHFGCSTGTRVPEMVFDKSILPRQKCENAGSTTERGQMWWGRPDLATRAGVAGLSENGPSGTAAVLRSKLY
jgi:hypothetical protein